MNLNITRHASPPGDGSDAIYRPRAGLFSYWHRRISRGTLLYCRHLNTAPSIPVARCGN